ncbi:hypothetical protein ACFX1S_042520 [Malus domestica]
MSKITYYTRPKTPGPVLKTREFTLAACRVVGAARVEEAREHFIATPISGYPYFLLPSLFFSRNLRLIVSNFIAFFVSCVFHPPNEDLGV